MTGDQWFTVAMSLVGAIAVIGGVLAGSYVHRKSQERHHVTSALKNDKPKGQNDAAS